MQGDIGLYDCSLLFFGCLLFSYFAIYARAGKRYDCAWVALLFAVLCTCGIIFLMLLGRGVL
jgi:hypothetical protein